MGTEQLIDEVARAIRNCSFVQPPWEKLKKDQQDWYRKLALAAMAAYEGGAHAHS